ncbi:MAG: hypothetical protein R2824_06580 [Saprospiraceae bacterium]|nr:DUF2207 domain-containing protein [Lewinella sp.]
MKLSLNVLLLGLFVLCFQFTQAAVVRPLAPAEKQLTLEQQEKLKAFEEKVSNLSAKDQEKLDKKLKKIQNKIDKRAKKGKKSVNQEKVNSGIGLGLVIVLVGVLIAILGFAGIADILVTIGLVVLVIGLILWLLAKI